MAAIKLDWVLKDCLGEVKTISSITALIRYIKQQVKFYENLEASLTLKGEQVPALVNRSYFDNALIQAEILKKDVDSSPNEAEIKRVVAAKQQIMQSYFTRTLLSSNPYLEHYVACATKYGHEGSRGFADYILKRPNAGQQQHDYNSGYFWGFNADNEANLKSTGSMRATKEALKSLDIEANELSIQIENRSELFDSLIFDVDYRSKKQRVKAYLAHRKLRVKVASEHKAVLDESAVEMEALERAYGEKLRLSKPAEYWNESALKFKNEGRLWSVLLVIALIAGTLMFNSLFHSFLVGEVRELDLKTLQGVILFATVVAVYGFFIKVLSKMVFSSFHLMRDSEEREQLTYLYLSLQNLNAIDLESRNLVLQSLFSRSDSGMLSGENGLKMPTINEALKAAGNLTK
ncbi:DUF6161 domain-containing protein [Agarivorans sp. 1_MG-2023]|uniref:DUF6161 domain-containing protein n=1 Tax=Agarivorans sp. 1_MG-2023 TaxID=3062634 RepID=UPI0026E37BF2|nr:DUF6161 domain-containing protein [Agarivorans sp. 1_MG-2023]MDO6762302.1 DUF6161 domain-containing protein [Agarivorans sp. 1_MG-2023]